VETGPDVAIGQFERPAEHDRERRGPQRLARRQSESQIGQPRPARQQVRQPHHRQVDLLHRREVTPYEQRRYLVL
jgi:hypothetical protein